VPNNLRSILAVLFLTLKRFLKVKTNRFKAFEILYVRAYYDTPSVLDKYDDDDEIDNVI